jgi:dihydrofolate reductase
MKPFDILVAADDGNGIGKDGVIQWRLPGDLKFLKRTTTQVQNEQLQNAVIMGRKTWETIPSKWQPLPRRLNAVVTRQTGYSAQDGVVVANSLEGALDEISEREDVERLFVLGGGEIYRLAVALDACRRIYLTRVEGRFEADAHFPELGDGFVLAEESERHEDNGIGYRFQTWARR